MTTKLKSQGKTWSMFFAYFLIVSFMLGQTNVNAYVTEQ